jgi:hypothetical protein
VKRFKVTLTTYVTAADDSAAAEIARGLAGSCFAVVSVDADEPAATASDDAAIARKTAATALERWKHGNKMAPELTRASSFDVVDALLRYVVAASKVGRA